MKGLENHGNTCYFNTALQCLFYIPAITNFYIKKPYKDDCSFTREYCKLVKRFWTKGEENVSSLKLLTLFRQKFPQFKKNEQHDVQETILYIIDLLERSTPQIKQWIYGKKTQETVWANGKSTNEEDFCVHLVTADSSDLKQIIKKSTDWNAIEGFVDSNNIKYNVAVSRMFFSKLPQVLMISFDRKSYIKSIENLVINNSEYNLISTAVHIGHQDDGHYVSFVKRKNKWFLVNDEQINEHQLPNEANFYFMVYNLKIQTSQYSP